MGAVDHAGRFFAELSAVNDAAGRPTLDYLVRRCWERGIAVSDSTVNDWLKGESVPSRRSQRACMEIVKILEAMALQRTAGFVQRPDAWWQGLLGKAREQRAEKRGGRPPRAKETRRGPMMLPADVPDFTGRGDAVRELTSWLEPGGEGTVSVVSGMGGAGKTALAVHAAHRVKHRFPGGALFADLRGYSPETPWEAGATAEHLLRALGKTEAPATPEEAVGLWRTALSRLEAPILVVLDNAATAGQISPLIPEPPHRLLVTSRNTLSALPGPRIELAPFDAEGATSLLDRALRRTNPEDDRVAARPDDARRLADLCGHLPLALHIVAALLRDDPDTSLAAQADELTEAHDRLDRLRYDDIDEQGRPLAVRAAFELSYRRLDAAQARAFRLLGAMPGADTDLETASAVIDRADTGRLLADLTRLHLLRRNPGKRWDMHDLIRLYAAELARDHDDENGAALDRLLEHYQRVLGLATCWLGPHASPRSERFPDRSRALRWLDDESRNLAASVAAAHADARWEQTCAMAAELVAYWEFRRHVREWIGAGKLALAAAEHLGPEKVHAASGMLGNAYRVAHRYDEAMPQLRRSLELAPDRPAMGRARHNLGLVHFCLGDYAEAEACHRIDMEICWESGDLYGSGEALTALGDALRMQGKHEAAADTLNRAVLMFSRLNHPEGEIRARTNLALTLLGWNPALYGSCGIWHLCHALRLARKLDHHHAEATIFLNLAALYLGTCPACHGRAALKCATHAATRYERHDDQHGLARAWRNLGQAQRAVGDPAAGRRTLERARAAFKALGAFEPAAEIARQLTRPDEGQEHIPGCLGGKAGARLSWLDELPDSVLRGDFSVLDGFVFLDFRYAVWQPAADQEGDRRSR